MTAGPESASYSWELGRMDLGGLSKKGLFGSTRAPWTVSARGPTNNKPRVAAAQFFCLICLGLMGSKKKKTGFLRVNYGSGQILAFTGGDSSNEEIIGENNR